MLNIPPPDSPNSLVAQGRNVRRSYSLSRITVSPQSSSPYPPRRYASCPAHRCYPTAPTQYHTPLEDFPTSPLSWDHSTSYQSVSTVQSASVLNRGNHIAPFDTGLTDENQGKQPMSQMNDAHNGHHGLDSDLMQNESTYQQLHRLSLLTNTGSERASTLIGSDAEDEDPERDDGNPFDSVRTRVNEGAMPSRVELLFDHQDLPEGKYISAVDANNEVPSTSTEEQEFRHHEGFSESKGKENSPKRGAEDRDHEEDDEAGWDSDWGSPKRTRLERPKSSDTHSFFLVDHMPDEEHMVIDAHENAYNKNDEASGSWKSSKMSPSDRQKSLGSHGRSKSLPSKTAKHVASENWDDDFEDDGFGLGQGEVIVPQAIQERQYKVILHLDSVREFATLVEKLKQLVEQAISCGIRWGATEYLWDEAEAVIAIASTGTSDDEGDGGVRGRPIGSDIKTRRNQGSKGFNGGRSCPSKPLGNVASVRHQSTSASDRGHLNVADLASTEDVVLPTNKSDPVAMARMMMERMQHTSGTTPSDPNPETFQFDTKMLGPLLEKSRKLLRDLEDSIQDYSVTQSDSLHAKVPGT